MSVDLFGYAMAFEVYQALKFLVFGVAIVLVARFFGRRLIDDAKAKAVYTKVANYALIGVVGLSVMSFFLSANNDTPKMVLQDAGAGVSTAYTPGPIRDYSPKRGIDSEEWMRKMRETEIPKGSGG